MSVDYQDARAMEDILRKLETATASSTQRIVEESQTNSDVMMAMNTSKTQAGVKIATYEIIPEKIESNGLRKNYYKIVDTTNNTVMYDDISLFESAMSITKRLMLGKKLNDIKTIVELDRAYDTKLIESYSYKYKMKRITESMKRDVYEAKYSNALGKVKSYKERILKTL